MSKLNSPHFVLASNEDNLQTIYLEDVARHESLNDCWIIIYDRIYDVTTFIKQHPGGEHLLMEHAGRDATIAFRGAGHSDAALKLLNNFLIGALPENQRLFRTSDGYKFSNIPM